MGFNSHLDECQFEDSEEVSVVCSKCSSGLEATVGWPFGGLEATFERTTTLTVVVEGVAGEADFEIWRRTCEGW